MLTTVTRLSRGLSEGNHLGMSYPAWYILQKEKKLLLFIYHVKILDSSTKGKMLNSCLTRT